MFPESYLSPLVYSVSDVFQPGSLPPNSILILNIYFYYLNFLILCDKYTFVFTYCIFQYALYLLYYKKMFYYFFKLQELECQVLQSLLFCMHAFLTAKVASVDPAFLSSIQQSQALSRFPFQRGIIPIAASASKRDTSLNIDPTNRYTALCIQNAQPTPLLTQNWKPDIHKQTPNPPTNPSKLNQSVTNLNSTIYQRKDVQLSVRN